MALLWAPLATAQSLLDVIDSEIIVETLSESEYSIPVPYLEVELQPALSDVAQTALLRGLDRINGTAQDIVIAVSETVTYERLEVTLLACRYPRGDINSDAFAQLVISDVREEVPRFIGWMFASSPALSALDHPRYDVWVLSCQSS
ncbi:MAG: DUF2155 domain-containing protein [Rhodobacteraceae bacterium]|nr:DUF2155 domain-containing protein [Paracoccaceae bacterium]